jgi:hypothetical protein
MKKIVFITLLCFSVAAIAVTSGNSQSSGIASAGVTNIADTTPKTHHTMVKKPAHNSTMHKATTKTKTKSKATKPTKKTKSAKDSTTKK